MTLDLPNAYWVSRAQAFCVRMGIDINEVQEIEVNDPSTFDRIVTVKMKNGEHKEYRLDRLKPRP